VWVIVPLVTTASIVGGFLYYRDYETANSSLSVSRNFYGVLRITEHDSDRPSNTRRKLTHGRTLHGVQFVTGELSKEPTTYYTPDSGVGLILTTRNLGHSKRVGIVGLGVGTLAAYANSGDQFRFYDINPDVVQLATEYFTYLRDCEGDVQTVLGDARLTMEREEPQEFDVLVLDAFSSDAIPVHLLTVEAFEVYEKHLASDGVLAVHISNRHFDLRPVVEGLADHFGMTVVDVVTGHPDDDPQERSASNWLLLSKDAAALSGPIIQEAAEPPQEKRLLWTDHRNNLFEVLK
jgi:tRNA A58 N-methylase Trm61